MRSSLFRSDSSSCVKSDDASPLLVIRGLSRCFGSVRAIEQIDLEVHSGELLGLMGGGGAGKSTLLDLVTGSLSATAGKVCFGGRDVTDLSAWQRSHLGIGRTQVLPKQLRNMTVFEGVLVAAGHALALGLTEAKEVAGQVLESTGLTHRAREFAGNLSLLDAKRLELARALTVQPRLLLLDEITGGLTKAEVEELLAIVCSLRDRGIAVIWIERALQALRRAATRLVILHEGVIVADGDPASLLANAHLREVC